MLIWSIKKFPGNNLTKEIFGSLNEEKKQKLFFDLANFLQEIHNSITAEKAHELGVESEDPQSYLIMIKNVLFEKIKNPDILYFIKQTCDEFEEMIKEKTELVFLYNDLHAENMAFDYVEKKLNGIFDFGDTMTGDINMDFYPLYKFDPYFMKSIVEKYQELTGKKLSLRRMIIYARINELCDLAEFINKPESETYRDALMYIEKWKKETDLFFEKN